MSDIAVRRPTFRWRLMPQTVLIPVAGVGILALLGLAGLNVQWQSALILALAWGIAAVPMDLWQGYLGELSFGHAAFVAIGAYTWAVGRGQLELSFVPAILLTVGVTAVAAAVIGAIVVRLSHFGAAIVTFFFAFIMAAALNSSALSGLVGSQVGLAVPALEIGGIDLSGGTGLYFFGVVLLLISVVLTANYARSSSGRALQLVREGTTVAALLGVRIKYLKWRTFVFTATVGSLGGIVLAQQLMFVTPDSFTAIHSVVLVAMVVVGGQRTVVGPLVGAVIYQSIPTLFQSSAESQVLYAALAFLVVVVLLPAGIYGGAKQAVVFLVRRLRPRTATRAVAVPHVDPDDELVELLTAETPDRQAGDTALDVREVSVEFAGVRALDSVSLQVKAHTVHALIGPNGAGKTTLINAISGIERRATGECDTFGQRLTHLSPRAIRDSGVGRTFQNPALVGNLSLLDNVWLGLYSRERRHFALELVRGRTSHRQDRLALERCANALALLGIEPEFWAKEAASVSLADRKLADLARAVVAEPHVLLLDEPTAGLSEAEMQRVAHAITTICERAGTTVVVVAHHVAFIRQIAHVATVLDAGAVLASGSPDDVTNDPAVLEAFIGKVTSPKQQTSPATATTVTVRERDGAIAREKPRSDEAGGLVVSGLRVAYGAARVVDDLTLTVRPGELVGLTGRNGAGKTTTLRALSGLIPRSYKTLTLDGQQLPAAPAAIAKARLIHVPEGRGVIAPLTVLENLSLGAYSAGVRQPDLGVVLDLFPRLRRLLTSRAGLLSGGEQQMLAIARGLLAQPRVLMIDELSLGLSPKAAADALEVVANIARNGPGVLVVDQNIATLASTCDRMYIVRAGTTTELEQTGAETADALSEIYF